MLSRGDRTNFARESVDLSLTTEEAAEKLLPLAEQRRITLDVIGEAALPGAVCPLMRRVGPAGA